MTTVVRGEAEMVWMCGGGIGKDAEDGTARQEETRKTQMLYGCSEGGPGVGGTEEHAGGQWGRGM